MLYIYLQCVINNKKLILYKSGLLEYYINNNLVHSIEKCTEFDLIYFRDNFMKG